MSRIRESFESPSDYIRQSRELLRRHPRLAIVVSAVVLLLSVTTFVWAGRLAVDVLAGLPGRQELRHMGKMAQSTTLFDVSDHPVFSISKEQRIDVPLKDVAPSVERALIAVEDQRFYEHSGVDITRVLGAAWSNFRAQRAAQGGSTLTQQLARQSFLSSDKTFRRKLREVVLAARIERLFTKKEILELYLNKVYFGDGLYGIEAASRGYFGKKSSELSLSESALLAGLVKSPSTYAPTVSMQKAVTRRNLVLQRMLESGVITREQWAQARADTVALHDALRRDETWGQYFKEQVRQELVQRFGWERVSQDGLRVYTTIDGGMQKQAEEAVAKGIAEVEAKRAVQAARPKGKAAPAPDAQKLEAALVALDPGTGEVRAMVGGRDYEGSRFNRAMQARRQPGSAFKPIVYAAALESGFTPATLLDNLADPVNTPEGEWMPEDEHAESNSMTLRTGLRTSSNRAAVRLLRQIGVQRTVDYAHRLGIDGLPNVPSIALGSGEVTLLTLAAAYIPFANKGMAQTPTLIRRVEDRDGTVLYSAEEKSRQVLNPTTAFLMAQMLADVINSGTAYKARRLGFTLPAAGKTGTTNDYNDAWFVGFTPHLLAGVWVGFDQPATIMRNGYAAEVAVPVWTRFMAAATRADKPDWYAAPSNVVGLKVCRVTGKLATPGCEHVRVLDAVGEFQERSMAYTEYFVRGTEPVEECALHRDPGFFDRLAGLFGRPDGQAGAGVPTAGFGAGDPSRPPPAADARAGDQKPERKGFWGRLFGAMKGKDGEDPRKKEEERRRKEKEKERKERERLEKGQK